VLSEKEFRTLSAAMTALGKNDFDAALRERSGLKDKAAIALFDWLYMRDVSLHAGFTRIAAFIKSHPDWPHQTTLNARMEAASYLRHPPAKDVIAALTRQGPRSGIGMAALARAYLETGQEKKAAKWVRTAWREHLLTGGEEKLIAKEFSKYLRREDHKARLDYLLYRDYTSSAARHAQRLGAQERALVNARRAVNARSKSAGKMLASLSAEMRKDPVAQLSRIQWLRRRGKDETATKLMLAAPRTDDVLVDGWQWWEERRILVREMLDRNDAKSAYRLAADHEISHPVAFAEASFLAGWVALRYLDQPAEAKEHFLALRDTVSTPISTARAQYWLGRTEEALGNEIGAQVHFRAAAEHPTTFYGQLGYLRVAGRNAHLVLSEDPQATAAERAAFHARPQIRAARLLYEMGDTRLAGSFLRDYAKSLSDLAEIALAGDLADRWGLTNVAVQIGKDAVNSGKPVYQLAFLTGGIPPFKPAGTPVEHALLYAIARQESLFNPAAQSPAGARGLMQLMPSTAKRTARRMSIPFNVNRLTQDAAYNARIGSAHIGELMAEMRDSYIMIIAGYNAGGGRVRQWIAAHGDPRNPSIDPIDWIERIPFSETRNYVQRVLENLQVYRARLNGERHPIELAADFKRGQ
jgi:soluble lytic murein transglycosylase